MLRVLLAIALVTGAALADDSPKRVAPDVALEHLTKKVDAVAPAIAVVAGVGGKVGLDAVISADGKVVSTTFLRGPVLLQRACMDAVSQWQYKPFLEDGKAVSVITTVECMFSSPVRTKSEEDALQKYYPVDATCEQLLRAREYPEAEKKCSEAMALADQLPKERILERGASNAYLANTLLIEGKLDEAIPLYQKSLEIYRGIAHSEQDADFATAHVNLARAYFLAKQFDKADPLYARAIEIFEAAIAALPTMKDNYTVRMKRAIVDYATLKEAEGDTAAAKNLNQKAAAIP